MSDTSPTAAPLTSRATSGKRGRWRWVRAILTTLVCIGILSGSAAAVVVIQRTQPTAQTLNATRKSAALVRTKIVQRGSYSPRLTVLGTVQAAQDVLLSPRVSGQVTEISPSLIPGGMVNEGDLLLRIDPADFENALAISQSELERAEASMAIEAGRQSLAKKELALLEGTIDETNKDLVLRKPQLASIKAEVNAAKSAVERAKLDLERTRVTAPFDAQIISRSVNIGSQVSPGDELARLVGVDQYWVMAAVPVRSLRWVQFPEGDSQGSEVVLRNTDAWPEGAERKARVARLIGALNLETRMARVLITADDPLGVESNSPALILDTLIETEIIGVPIDNVVRLEREFVRDQDTVWVMKDGKLEIRETDVVFRDAKYAYIQRGLDDGDEIVISTLATVANGVGLRRLEDAESENATSAGPESDGEDAGQEDVL